MNNSYNVTTDLKQQQYIPSQPGSYAPPNQPASSTVLIVPGGGCPSCRVGVLDDTYGCCAICLAIFFFPVGIVCCLAMKEKQCVNCGAVF